MGFFELIFGTPKPNPKVELRAKAEKIEAAINEFMKAAKTDGYKAEMKVTNGDFSLNITEEIVSIKINNKIQKPTK